jgi:hypothetical protein
VESILVRRQNGSSASSPHGKGGPKGRSEEDGHSEEGSSSLLRSLLQAHRPLPCAAGSRKLRPGGVTSSASDRDELSGVSPGTWGRGEWGRAQDSPAVVTAGCRFLALKVLSLFFESGAAWDIRALRAGTVAETTGPDSDTLHISARTWDSSPLFLGGGGGPRAGHRGKRPRGFRLLFTGPPELWSHRGRARSPQKGLDGRGARDMGSARGAPRTPAAGGGEGRGANCAVAGDEPTRRLAVVEDPGSYPCAPEDGTLGRSSPPPRRVSCHRAQALASAQTPLPPT